MTEEIIIDELYQTLQEIKETIKSIEKDAINGLNNSASFSKNSEFESIQNKANKCIKLIMSDDTVKLIMGTLKRLEQENKELIEDNLNLSKENKELEKQHYEVLKMLKHEYDGRQRDNEQWFTRCTENHNEDSKIIENYRSALEEIRNYCDRIKQGSVIGTQDCLINSIKNITNEVLNA